MKKQHKLYKSVEGIFNLKHSLEHVFFRSFTNHYAHPENLFHTHILTLVILSSHKILPMSEVSRRLNLEKGSFTPVAAKLIKLGYIQKTQDESDKRVYNLELTDLGLEVADDFKEKHLTYINQLVAQFSEDERKEYFEAIDKVYQMTKRLEI
jgi:DNA-binding MarR family transcriptional regulator